MVEPVKSVLLVDLDGLGRSLAAAGGEGVDKRLSERIDDWSGAIESGELIEPAGTLRTIAQRRCYVGSASADAARVRFVNAGFEMVECDGQAQVELSLAIDATDAAADADGAFDFILLTAALNLTPLVERLHARGHRVAIYASETTTADYQAAADMVIPAKDLIAFLAEDKAAPAAAASAADRSKIEAFAREIHEATNIPMFSPKTFADLFRVLAAEVTQRGYHFNQTAKTVAERLASAGRNVNSRQVVFVVKGLALKGHVFSTSDTPERLAEVFRDQARYLIGGAGITLDAEREALLDAWISAPAAAKPARPPAAEAKPARKPAPERRPEKPAAARPATPPRVPERPKSAALPAKAPPRPPATAPAKPARTADDLRATIAARIAASAKMKPSSTRPPAKPDGSAPPPSPRRPANAPADDAIESSILAAIAEAVDVLVDDGGDNGSPPTPPDRQGREPPARRPPAERPPAADRPTAAERPTAADRAPPAEEPEEEGGDIGDEIQRIVASYNRNREDDRRG